MQGAEGIRAGGETLGARNIQESIPKGLESLIYKGPKP